MSELQAHLYMVSYPNSALVLSQLEPDLFLQRYCYGTTSYHPGKLIFAELDRNYRDPYFKLEEALANLKPHKNGRPKATKYVADYRILEHVRREAIQALYLANADGSFLRLEPAPYTPSEQDERGLHLYAEISPITMLTLASYSFRDFGGLFTGGHEFLSVPRFMYTELALDVDLFQKTYAENPFAPSPIEGVHPQKLNDAIEELRRREDKDVKGLSLDSSFGHQSFRMIRHGIMIKDAEGELFFPLPPAEEIEAGNLKFYRSM